MPLYTMDIVICICMLYLLSYFFLIHIMVKTTQDFRYRLNLQFQSLFAFSLVCGENCVSCIQNKLPHTKYKKHSNSHPHLHNFFLSFVYFYSRYVRIVKFSSLRNNCYEQCIALNFLTLCMI